MEISLKAIPTLPGYMASALGQVFSIRSGEPREIKQRTWKNYRIVTVTVGSQRHRLPVHRLVALAFRGEPDAGANEARHLDGNSLNNIESNLAWGSRFDNAQDAIGHGTLGAGMKARHRRLTDDQARSIAMRHQSGERSTALASEFNIHSSYVLMISKGKRWSCLGVGASKV